MTSVKDALMQYHYVKEQATLVSALRKVWHVKWLPVFQEEFHQFAQAGKSCIKGDFQTVSCIDLPASPHSILMG